MSVSSISNFFTNIGSDIKTAASQPFDLENQARIATIALRIVGSIGFIICAARTIHFVLNPTIAFPAALIVIAIKLLATATCYDMAKVGDNVSKIIKDELPVKNKNDGTFIMQYIL